MTKMLEDLSTNGVAHDAESLTLGVENLNKDDNNNNKTPVVNGEKPKKRGLFNIFKFAFGLMNKKSNEKPKPATNSTEVENWKKLVGSIRPLHLIDDDEDDNQSPAPPPPPPFPSTLPWAEEIISPGASPTPPYLLDGTMSQYASATNLQELDNPDDESDVKANDAGEVFDALTGDKTIDAKAKQFISQFYQQMRLQNSH